MTTLLKADHIHVNIGNKTICDGFHLHLHHGEIVGILGPNGSGKTTLLHALSGLHPLQKGQIFLGDSLLHQLSLRAVAKKIGLLFQDFNAAFPQTVREYCLASRYPHSPYFKNPDDDDQEIVSHALAVVELHPLHHRSIVELSGGEKRRLAIAALLSQTPQIYLLDEPTNHLDVRHQIKVLKHFHHLAKNGAAILMTLHDVNWVQQFCDRVILLYADGSVLEGSREELLTAQNLTRLYQHPMTSIVTMDGTYWQAAI